MYRSLFSRDIFPRDLFAELERWQRDTQQLQETGSSIRGLGRSGFPALNVGSTPQSIELYAFVPGVNPASLEVHLEKGVLTIAGERASDVPERGNGATVHINERFAGRFRRVVSLPDDADPNGISAECRDGVVHISVKRLAAVQPRRISIQ